MTTRLFCRSLLAALFVLAGFPGPLRAVDPPTPADAAGLGPLPLALDHTPDAPLVLRISQTLGASGGTAGRDPNVVTAARGDELFVAVQRLEEWVRAAKDQGHGDKTDIIDLVLYLNGSPLPGVHPDRVIAFHEWIGAPLPHSDNSAANGRPGRLHFVRPVSDTDSTGVVPAKEPIEYTSRPVHYLHFILDSTPGSRAAWHQLLRRPDFNPRSLEVSVGFEDGRALRSYVGGNGRQAFQIVTLPLWRFWSGVAIILGSLLIFLVLARDTDIIRDPHAPLRPDGRWPYSLARTQLACWFFLVLTSFFFLWVLTGEMDTLNTSVLTLLGISAGTALGAAFVDASHDLPRPEEAGKSLAEADLSQPKRKILERLAVLLAEAEAELRKLEAARAEIDKNDKEAYDKNGADIKLAQDRVRTLNQQMDYFRQPTWKGVFLDLLVERGYVSFHRFQILVWTLVLGLMFVAGVYSETSMPEFNSTLLGLLGVSGGTFVGFKLTPTQKEAAAGPSAG